MLKNIVKNLKPSSTLKINEVCKELESKGEKFLSLVLASLLLKYLMMLLMN